MTHYTIINKEETHVKEQIELTLTQWYQTRSTKQDKIGVFILRLHDFVNESIPVNVEKALKEIAYDLVYDISVRYIEDDDSYLMDKLRHLLDKFLINKCEMSIMDVAMLIKNQAETKMTNAKIKSKIKVNIDNLKKIRTKKITKIEVLDSLGKLVVSQCQSG